MIVSLLFCFFWGGEVVFETDPVTWAQKANRLTFKKKISFFFLSL